MNTRLEQKMAEERLKHFDSLFGFSRRRYYLFESIMPHYFSFIHPIF